MRKLIKEWAIYFPALGCENNLMERYSHNWPQGRYSSVQGATSIGFSLVLLSWVEVVLSNSQLTSHPISEGYYSLRGLAHRNVGNRIEVQKGLSCSSDVLRRLREKFASNSPWLIFCSVLPSCINTNLFLSTRCCFSSFFLHLKAIMDN